MKHTVLFHPDGVSVSVETGTSVLEAMIAAGLAPDAPCGGKGTCGKILTAGEKDCVVHKRYSP